MWWMKVNVGNDMINLSIHSLKHLRDISISFQNVVCANNFNNYSHTERDICSTVWQQRWMSVVLGSHVNRNRYLNFECMAKNTRSSQQWWSGRSTTTHIVKWWNGENIFHCFHSFGALPKVARFSLHHFTFSQCALLTFSSTSNRLAEIWKGDFSTSGLGGYGGHMGSGEELVW